MESFVGLCRSAGLTYCLARGSMTLPVLVGDSCVALNDLASFAEGEWTGGESFRVLPFRVTNDFRPPLWTPLWPLLLCLGEGGVKVPLSAPSTQKGYPKPLTLNPKP